MPLRPFGGLLSAVGVLVLAVALIAPAAEANSAPVYRRWFPESGGVVVPTTTSSVRIERERLRFDVADDGSTASVRAEYDLTNVSASDVALDLMFIAPSAQGLTLTLDGKPLEVKPVDDRDVEIPGEWRHPNKLVDPRTGKEKLGPSPATTLGGGSTPIWLFQLNLPSQGKGTMAATYRAGLGYNTVDYDRDLVYVLGPAKSWAGFGTLDVEANVPSTWAMATLPALSKVDGGDGRDRYAASFQGVPSDLFRIGITPRDASGQTVSQPKPVARPVGVSPLMDRLLPIGFLLPLLIGAVVGVACGLIFTRIGRRISPIICGGVVSFLAALVVCPLLSLWVFSSVMATDPSLPPSGNVGASWVTLGTAVLIAPAFAAIVGAVGTSRGRSRLARS